MHNWFASFGFEVLWTLVGHCLDELFLRLSDVLHCKKRALCSAFSDFYLDLHLNWTLPSQVPLESLLQPRDFRGSSDNDHIFQQISFCSLIIKGQNAHNGLNYIHLVETNQLWLEVNLMALDKLAQKKQLIGWIEVMVILLMRILRVDFSQFCFHHINITESFFLFLLSQFFKFLFLLKLFLIELFFGQPCNNLHFLFIVLAFSVGHFGFHSFVFFGFLWHQFELLFQQLQIQFWIVFAKLFHSLLLFFFFALLFPSLFDCFLLINLHSFELELFGWQLMVGNVNQWEFLFFRLLWDQAQFYLKGFYFFYEFLVGLVVAKHFSSLFMSAKVMFFVLFLKLHESIELMLLHFAFHLLSS